MAITKYFIDKVPLSHSPMVKTMRVSAAAAPTVPLPCPTPRAQGAGAIRVGSATPATGLLGPFGETDGVIASRIEKLIERGLKTAPATCNMKILVGDGWSNPYKAARFFGDLILNYEVHIIISTLTSDTINPLAQRVKLFETPCESTAVPSQVLAFPSEGHKEAGRVAQSFFLGLDDVLNTFVGLCNAIETNRKVSMVYPKIRMANNEASMIAAW